MSAAIRDALAAAANTVLGPKKVSAYYRASIRPGDGWVSFARFDRDDTGFGYMDRWEIRVALHQDIATAEEWVDTNTDALTAAIAEHLIITSAVMVTLVTDTGNTPGLIIEGTRPHQE